ncbi:MAG: hypothetical protein ACOZNI_04790 [Myxococcota bacterium]
MTVALFAMLAAEPALAGELVWEGFYRGRGLFYDTLSLAAAEGNDATEGSSQSFDHRMSLRPTWRVSEHASLHAQLELNAFTTWGEETATYADPVSGTTIARAEADGVAPSAVSIAATRAWGEANTGVGRFAMGRMPMQWGGGILWNDGNDVLAEYGDTADRVQWSGRFGPVFVLAAWDVQYEGFLGQEDDMQAASLAFGYRSETAGVGLLNNYRYQADHADDDKYATGPWQAYTGDLWGFTRLGPVQLELEAVAHFGGGNLSAERNDVDAMAFGGMLNADWKGEKFGLGLQGGFATGDADPDDEKLRTFSFDRDHNVALLLFEEPMPTLETGVINNENEGRTEDAALTGDGISNALYLRPAARYTILPGLQAEAAWIGALTAKTPAAFEGNGGYGNEFDLSVRYDPHPHVWVQGTFGVFLPGKYYTEYEDADFGGGFDKTAVGARVVGVVEF